MPSTAGITAAATLLMPTTWARRCSSTGHVGTTFCVCRKTETFSFKRSHEAHKTTYPSYRQLAKGWGVGNKNSFKQTPLAIETVDRAHVPMKRKRKSEQLGRENWRDLCLPRPVPPSYVRPVRRARSPVPSTLLNRRRAVPKPNRARPAAHDPIGYRPAPCRVPRRELRALGPWPHRGAGPAGSPG